MIVGIISTRIVLRVVRTHRKIIGDLDITQIRGRDISPHFRYGEVSDDYEKFTQSDLRF